MGRGGTDAQSHLATRAVRDAPVLPPRPPRTPPSDRSGARRGPTPPPDGNGRDIRAALSPHLPYAPTLTWRLLPPLPPPPPPFRLPPQRAALEGAPAAARLCVWAPLRVVSLKRAAPPGR